MTSSASADGSTDSPCGSLLDRICGGEFEAEVFLASGYRFALRAAREHLASQALVRHLGEHPSDAAKVLARIEDLSRREIDAQWASPHEAALLGLLSVVTEAAAQQASFAVAQICNVPNAPWARRLAAELVVDSMLREEGYPPVSD